MNQHNEIPLIQKIFSLYKLTYESAKTFPKSDKYALGETIKIWQLEIMELLIAAQYANRDFKQPLLEKTSHKLELLKLLFRLAHEIKILDDKKYLNLSGQLLEIGRMVGGWLRTVK